jgi:hypothetical protein
MSWTTPEPSQQQRVPTVAAGAPARAVTAAASRGPSATPSATSSSFATDFAAINSSGASAGASAGAKTSHDDDASARRLQDIVDKELDLNQQAQATEQVLKEEVLTALREQLEAIDDDDWMFKDRPII